MRRYLAYLKSLLIHKYWVFYYGFRVGVNIWQLITHDWSKFMPWEFVPYANQFYNADGSSRKEETYNSAFDAAWLHHQNVQPHHWQYWVLIMDTGAIIELEMPEKYAREMLADWHGAGRAYNGKGNDTQRWYLGKKSAMRLHPKTRIWIEEQLGIKEGNPIAYTYRKQV